MTADQVSAQVLDAAAVGGVVPGFENVGRLLIDLGRTNPISPAAAISSSSVAAAAAASTPSITATAAVVLAKPITILLALGALALGGVATVAMTSADERPSRVETPRVKSVEEDGPSVTSQPGVQRVVKPLGPTTTVLEDIVTPAETVSTSAAPAAPSLPSTLAPTTTTTSAPSTTSTEALDGGGGSGGGSVGSDGNGNGKGNNGSGKGNGGSNGG